MSEGRGVRTARQVHNDRKVVPTSEGCWCQVSTIGRSASFPKNLFGNKCSARSVLVAFGSTMRDVTSSSVVIEVVDDRADLPGMSGAAASLPVTTWCSCADGSARYLSLGGNAQVLPCAEGSVRYSSVDQVLLERSATTKVFAGVGNCVAAEFEAVGTNRHGCACARHVPGWIGFVRSGRLNFGSDALAVGGGLLIGGAPATRCGPRTPGAHWFRHSHANFRNRQEKRTIVWYRIQLSNFLNCSP